MSSSNSAKKGGDTSSSNSATLMDIETWIHENDIGKLEDFLSVFAMKLADKRKEPSKYPAWAVLLTSGMVFAGVYLALVITGLQGSELSLNAMTGLQGSELSLNAMILAITSATIPSISYAVLRNREVQHRNDELAALSLEIRELRSKITTLHQQQVLAKKEKREARVLLANAGHGMLLKESLELDNALARIKEEMKIFNKAATEVLKAKDVKAQDSELLRRDLKEINLLEQKDRNILEKITQQYTVDIASYPTKRVNPLKITIAAALTPSLDLTLQLGDATKALLKTPTDLSDVLKKTRAVVDAINRLDQSLYHSIK